MKREVWSSEVSIVKSEDKSQEESDFLRNLLIRPIVFSCSLSFYRRTKIKGEEMDNEKRTIDKR
jgi:hypothetical protein